MVAAVLALILVACAPGAMAENREQTIDSYQQQTRTLADGRTMQCLVHESGTGYAVTCDWAGAK